MDLRKAGKPRQFRSVEHFDAIFDNYLKSQEREGKPPTLIGAALMLGFVSVGRLDEFVNERPIFANSVARVRSTIENWLVEQVSTNQPHTSGQQFVLNTIHGHAKTSEVDMKGVNIEIKATDADL